MAKIPYQVSKFAHSNVNSPDDEQQKKEKKTQKQSMNTSPRTIVQIKNPTLGRLDPLEFYNPSEHYSSVTQPLRRLKSPATQLLVDKLVGTNGKETIKSPLYWPHKRAAIWPLVSVEFFNSVNLSNKFTQFAGWLQYGIISDGITYRPHPHKCHIR